MATAFTHAVAALAIGSCFYRPSVPKRVWVAGVACSVIPDLDVLGFRYGVHYGDFWGHRGFTHSLLFAALAAVIIMIITFRRGAPPLSRSVLLAYLFIAGASHGLLDAMTSGGLGVAFFSPFHATRYFLPWRPILVSPISAGRFFSHRAYAIMASKLLGFGSRRLCFQPRCCCCVEAEQPALSWQVDQSSAKPSTRGQLGILPAPPRLSCVIPSE